MPVDELGNRADIIAGSETVVGRMNTGVLYEHYLSAACVQVKHNLVKLLGVKAPRYSVSGIPTELKSQAWDMLIDFYSIASVKMYEWYRDGTLKPSDESLEFILQQMGVNIFFPPNTETEYSDLRKGLQSSIHKPHLGKVTYRGHSGKVSKTKLNVRIAPMYFALLEKIADDWNAVPSPKLQTSGVPAGTLSKQDKVGRPARYKATKATGEAEIRIMTAYCGGRFAAEILDRNNNPRAHRAIVDAIYSTPTPGNIAVAVDRNKISFGGSRAWQLVSHYCLTAGAGFAFEDYKPRWAAHSLTLPSNP